MHCYQKVATLNSPNQLRRALDGLRSAEFLSSHSKGFYTTLEGRALGCFKGGAARSALTGRGACSAWPSSAAVRPRFLTILFNAY